MSTKKNFLSNRSGERSGLQALLLLPPSRGQRQILLVCILGALTALGPLSIDMYLPALPALSRDFGTTASQVQLTLSACLLGLALGQAFAGPLSDLLGRRRPLLIGLTAYALASLLCIVAPSVSMLIALRFIQGFAGAAGIVIANAIVRDLYAAATLARFFSLLMLVNGLAPILAPLCGGLLLHFTSWHGVFIVLAVIGTLLLLASASNLGETLPKENRQSGGISATLTTFRRLLTSRSFVGSALSCGLALSAMFAYISGSPFILQEIYNLSPQMFSIVFGINALGLIVTSQVNGHLVRHIQPARLLTAGLIASAIGGGTLFTVVIIGSIGLKGILPSLFMAIASLGFVLPNATTLALSEHTRNAGSASALLGTLQFSLGAAVAPLIGLFNVKSALPMSVIIATLGISALVVFALLTREDQHLRPDNQPGMKK